MEQKRSGQYKKAKKAGYKVAGLTAEQSKRATTLKGKKVSAAQLKKANVLQDIGTTRWEKGKGVVGPGGKAFTGSVILASGKTATYVKGRRVGVQTKPRSGGSKSGGGSTGKPAASSKNVTATRPRSVSDFSSKPPKKSGTRPKSPSDFSRQRGGLTIEARPWDKRKKPWSSTFYPKPFGIYK